MGKIIWLTGNSGAGKTTLAKYMCDNLMNWVNLDGDEMRDSISLGAGFSKEEREEHNLRVARLAKVLSNNGHNVVISVIAPFQSTRDKINQIIDCNWVYLKRNLTVNISRPYEIPTAFTIDVDSMSVEDEYAAIINECRLFNVFVIGLPRSGTSMMTNIVRLLGVDIISSTEKEENKMKYDKKYREHFGTKYHPNSQGFYELTNVMELVEGLLKKTYCGCKLIAPIDGFRTGLLTKYNKFIFMWRNVEEIRQSQMAFYSSEVDVSLLKTKLVNQERQLKKLGLDYIKIDYQRTLCNTEEVVNEIKRFIKSDKLVAEAVKSVDSSLNRFKEERLIHGI